LMRLIFPAVSGAIRDWASKNCARQVEHELSDTANARRSRITVRGSRGSNFGDCIFDKPNV